MDNGVIVAIHQPNFIPWPGYFNKICKSDVFILLDDVEYTKNSLINRNSIKSQTNELRLTIPVRNQSMRQLILDTEIANHNSLRKTWRSIEQSYAKSAFFKEFSKSFEEIFSSKYVYIHELNIALILNILKILNIKTQVVRSSKLGLTNIGVKNDRIINLCLAVGATEYLSGAGAKKYNDMEIYSKASIDLTYQDFKLVEYSQTKGPFIEGLSIIDMLFNIGSEATKEFVC